MGPLPGILVHHFIGAKRRPLREYRLDQVISRNEPSVAGIGGGSISILRIEEMSNLPEAQNIVTGASKPLFLVCLSSISNTTNWLPGKRAQNVC